MELSGGDGVNEPGIRADAERNWEGYLNQILYAVQFRTALDQSVVENLTQRLQQAGGLPGSPGSYIRSIDTALEQDRPLSGGVDPHHSDQEIRTFLADLRDALARHVN